MRIQTCIPRGSLGHSLRMYEKKSFFGTRGGSSIIESSMNFQASKKVRVGRSEGINSRVSRSDKIQRWISRFLFALSTKASDQPMSG